MDPSEQPSKKVADVDDQHYRIEPLALKEKRALDFLNYYNHRCDATMRKTFGAPDEILHQARLGLRPTWINLRKAAQDGGLLIFNVDPQVTTATRINILQMSTTNREGLEEAVRLSLDYIWKNTEAEELRIGLHHFEKMIGETPNKKKKLVVDEEYKSLLKKFNFKWK